MLFGQKPNEDSLSQTSEDVLMISNLPDHHNDISDTVLNLSSFMQMNTSMMGGLSHTRMISHTYFNDASIVCDKLLRWNTESRSTHISNFVPIQPGEKKDASRACCCSEFLIETV